LICHKIKFRAHLAKTSGAAQPKDLCKCSAARGISAEINFLLASQMHGQKPGQINQLAIG